MRHDLVVKVAVPFTVLYLRPFLIYALRTFDSRWVVHNHYEWITVTEIGAATFVVHCVAAAHASFLVQLSFFFFETNGVYSNLRNKQHSELETNHPGEVQREPKSKLIETTRPGTGT